MGSEVPPKSLSDPKSSDHQAIGPVQTRQSFRCGHPPAVILLRVCSERNPCHCHTGLATQLRLGLIPEALLSEYASRLQPPCPLVSKTISSVAKLHPLHVDLSYGKSLVLIKSNLKAP